MRKIKDFLKAHSQIGLAAFAGFLIAQLQILFNFHLSPEVSAAFVQGIFTLIAALIAICVGYISYRAAHVPFEKKRQQAKSIIKYFVLNTQIDVDMANEELNEDSLYRMLSRARKMCDIDLFCFEKEYLECLPEKNLIQALSIKSLYTNLRSFLPFMEPLKSAEDYKKYSDQIKKTLETTKEYYEEAIIIAKNF